MNDKRCFVILAFYLLLAGGLQAQDLFHNGGFELWHGGYVHGEACCGPGLAVPDYWGIPEQLMAMPYNNFVYKAKDSAHVHSGRFATELATNTTTIDSAGDPSGRLAVLVPGTVTCAGIVGYGALGLNGDPYLTRAYSTGLPFNDSPSILFFHLMFNHDVPDTASYAYALTRWNNILMKEDTLAAKTADIPDALYPQGQWLPFTDTLHYLSSGLPDTLHLIFYGGRNADSSKAGNVTWLDDVSFYLVAGDTLPSGIVHLDPDDAVRAFPNPASGMLNVAADNNMKGCSFLLYDAAGREVLSEKLAGSNSSFSIAGLLPGAYLYRVFNTGGRTIASGEVEIDR